MKSGKPREVWALGFRVEGLGFRESCSIQEPRHAASRTAEGVFRVFRVYLDPKSMSKKGP